jgi:predicted nucleic acid-binding protein
MMTGEPSPWANMPTKPPPIRAEGWLRGPRRSEELAAQEALFPASVALPFGPAEAARAAQLYVSLPRRRGREVDLAIAACALTLGARLWTLNPRDFSDLAGLELYPAS